MDVPMDSSTVEALRVAHSQPLLRRAKAVECLAIRPGAAQSPNCVGTVAIASSSHGGNTWDGEVVLQDLRPKGQAGAATASGPITAELRQHDTVTAVAWAGNEGSHLCVASDSGDIGVYAVPADPFKLGAVPAKAVASLEYHDDTVSCIASVPSGTHAGRVVSAGWDGAIALWDAVGHPRTPLAVLSDSQHHRGPIHALAPHPLGSGIISSSSSTTDNGLSSGIVIASGGDDCCVRVAAIGGSSGGSSSVGNGSVIATIRTRHRVTSLAWACVAVPSSSPTSNDSVVGSPSHLLVGEEDGTASLFDVASLRLQPQGQWGDERRAHAPLLRLSCGGNRNSNNSASTRRHQAAVRAIAVTAQQGRSGLFIATGGDDGQIVVTRLHSDSVDKADGVASIVIRGGHGDFVRALAWAAPVAGSASGAAGDGGDQSSGPQLTLLSGGWDGLVVQHSIHALR